MNDVTLENQTITNQTLVFDGKKTYWLGKNLILRNCELIVKVAGRDFIDRGVEFHNCTIHFKRKLKGKRFNRAKFFNCRFLGEIGGNIGNGVFSATVFDEEPYVCQLEGGDFSASVLNWVRFINVDMSKLTLPRWPCFTIFNPYKHLPQMAAVKGWGNYGSLHNPEDVQYFGDDTGIGLCIAGLVKNYDVDEQLLYKELSALDFVYL